MNALGESGSARMKARKRVLLIGVLLAFAAIAYLLLGVIGLVPMPGDCITKQRAAYSNRSGFDFWITETDCDTLGKDAGVSIFASKAGEGTRTLLFKYDWTKYDDPVPEIQVSSGGTIRLSIAAVSSVFIAKNEWKYGKIQYDIGHIEYPTKAAEK